MAGSPGLESILRQWVRDAIGQLVSQARPEKISGFPRWERDADGGYRQLTRPTLRWNPFDVMRVKRLDSWQQVEQALQADNLAGKHLNQLVGTASAARRFDTEWIADYLLPTPHESTDWQAAFDRQYQKLRQFLETDQFDFVVIWPIPMLSADGAFPASLGAEDLTLDIMTDDELASALTVGLLPLKFPGLPVLTTNDSRQVCLRYRYALPKLIGDPSSVASPIVDQLRGRLELIQEAFEETFVLLFGAHSGIPGHISSAVDPTMGGWTTYTPGSILGSRSLNQISVDAEQAARIEATWDQICQIQRLPKQRGLALALRRLTYQAQRQRVEDEIVDVLIAAEALYLSDVAGATELGFRLALRSAALCDPGGLGMTRREVFDLMRAAYSVRSTIVHGHAPKLASLRLKGVQVLLSDFAQATLDIVRQGIRIATIHAIDEQADWPPDWDNMTLPAG